MRVQTSWTAGAPIDSARPGCRGTALWMAFVALAALGASSGCKPPAGTDAAPAGDSGLAPTCGNGVTESGESCDDGNAVPGDGCDSDCLSETPATACGNGVVEPTETCDDGATVAGDGCDSDCRLEPFACTVGGDLACDDQVSADTADGASGRDDHCAAATAAWSGPELVWRFTALASETVAFSLGPLGGAAGAGPAQDLDVLVTEGTCESVACAAGPSQAVATGPLAVTRLAAVAGTDYFVWVDGPAREGTPFDLRVGCAAGASCGDGALQGDEACDDGNIADADGCNASCLVEAAPEACAGTAAFVPVGRVIPALVELDLRDAVDVVDPSCAGAVPSCSSGPDAIVPLLLPPGATGLAVGYDFTGDVFLAVTARSPTCAERACADLYPATLGVQDFADIAGSAAPALVHLVVSACTRATAGRVALSLTAN